MNKRKTNLKSTPKPTDEPCAHGTYYNLDTSNLRVPENEDSLSKVPLPEYFPSHASKKVKFSISFQLEVFSVIV